MDSFFSHERSRFSYSVQTAFYNKSVYIKWNLNSHIGLKFSSETSLSSYSLQSDVLFETRNVSWNLRNDRNDIHLCVCFAERLLVYFIFFVHLSVCLNIIAFSLLIWNFFRTPWKWFGRNEEEQLMQSSLSFSPSTRNVIILSRYFVITLTISTFRGNF